MKRWWAINILWINNNFDILFVSAVLFAAFLDISVINIGLHLRLTTTIILTLFFIRVRRLSNVLKYFIFNNRILLLFSLYIVSLFFSISNADIEFLAIKQFILYVLLFLNVGLFLIIRVEINQFSRTVLLVILIASVIENIFALSQPIIAIRMGIVGILTRPSGFFPEPNMLGLSNAMMMGYVIPIVLIQNKMDSSKCKTLAAIVAVTIMMLLVLTNNRATLIAILFQCLVAFFLYFKRIWRMKIKFIILFTTVIAMFVLFFNATRFIPSLHGNGSMYDYAISRYTNLFAGNKNGNESINIRLECVKIAMSKFYQNPIFGGGLGNATIIMSPEVTRNLKERKYGLIKQSTEVMPLDVIGETGLFGVITSMLFFCTIIYNAYKNSIFYLKNPFTFILSAGSFLSIIGMLVNGLGSSPLTSHYFWWNIGLVFLFMKNRYSYKKYKKDYYVYK